MFTERPETPDVAAWWILARSPSRRPHPFLTEPIRRVPIGRPSTPSDPFAALQRLAEELQHLLEGCGAEPDFPAPATSEEDRCWLLPPLERAVGAGPFRLAIPIAGVSPDSLDVSIRDGVLIIRGRIAPEENAYRSSTAFHRIALPDGLNAARAEAKLSGGVLEVIIPRDGR